MLSTIRVLQKNSIKVITPKTNYTLPASKTKLNRYCLISCKQKEFDHYNDVIYSNLDQVPLASKGWTHKKSKDDYFIVNPIRDEVHEENYFFHDLGIHNDLVLCLRNQGIRKATEFQARAIQTVQAGNHTILAAETGCGKTISYLVPIVQLLIGRHSRELNSPKAVVIVPNRELAYQVGEVAMILSESVDVKVKVVVGGRTKKVMQNPDFDQIDILVATPGALGKLSTIGVYKLHDVQFAVLDEADTLLDDSFSDRINTLIKRMSQAQYILVSATLPRKLPDILSPIEGNTKEIISPKLHKPLLNITQKFLRLTKSAKPAHLLQLTKQNKDPMLIFTNKNETCNWLALFLRENGINCSNINGDMNYAIRIDQWNRFVGGKTNILAATDVGSRGLNTIQVRHVLNYDFPLYAADYLHRIGRVGRLGSPLTCKASNFISGFEEIRLVQQIEMAIRRNQPLQNVDGNITHIVQNKLKRKMRETL